ncbi:MAG: hypothetical protein OXL41_06800 [Nitrospinae bacterium]|nr:hypothetical protein [Nitrospinota bacterium]
MANQIHKKKGPDLAAWASAIAAIVSAITAGLLYCLTIEESDRSKKLFSLREIERVEKSTAYIKAPIHCINFLVNLEEKDAKKLFDIDTLTSSIVIQTNNADRSFFVTCLHGLGMLQGDIKSYVSELNKNYKTQTITITPELAQTFNLLTIDILNSIETLIEFSQANIGDNGIIERYIKNDATENDHFIKFLNFLCSKVGFSLGEEYSKELLAPANSCKSVETRKTSKWRRPKSWGWRQ